MVETRERVRRRKPFYTCNNHRRRGPTVCGSRHWIDVEAADRAVLDTISRHVLRTDVVDAAVDRALDRLLSGRLHR